MANFNNRVLYTGITNDLIKRFYEHKHEIIKGFTSKYNVTKLVYFEAVEDVPSAIAREKQIKNWHRPWKINLIQEKNPMWRDLYEDINK